MAIFFEKVKNFFSGQKALSEGFYDELADLLVEGDFGAGEAYKTVEELEAAARKEKIDDPARLREKLAGILEGKLIRTDMETSFSGDPHSTTVILLLGVNGVGKTTTAAKLASLSMEKWNRKPILAAADTFRAAAIDQIKIHGERLGVRVVSHRHGGDPAAVVYDAVRAALSGGGDTIIADTAGRMHTKNALVEELKKIDRVVETGGKESDFRYLKFLVLDATTGRNALAQAEIFHGAVELDGCILTKYDSSAKGGVVFSLSSELKLPVIWICEGEKYGDIRPFDPHGYVREFLGVE
ncbi:MAG: signal recognition particle-docking protein FtsY [Treponema sp.]|jgi:fused signal recognition particle receptor|nr:signal recognition particle-docking protein FtsY [Treponema sp.]